MQIDSVQIECFLAAAKHLNFSKAAEHLYISQPVLSRRIARLEKELERSHKMLGNPGFVNKAPAAKINAEKEKLAAYEKQYQAIMDRMSALAK